VESSKTLLVDLSVTEYIQKGVKVAGTSRRIWEARLSTGQVVLRQILIAQKAADLYIGGWEQHDRANRVRLEAYRRMDKDRGNV